MHGCYRDQQGLPVTQAHKETQAVQDLKGSRGKLERQVHQVVTERTENPVTQVGRDCPENP